MHRKFIATVVAAAIAITSVGATPVRAEPSDLTKALIAALGVAAIGALIKNRNDDDDDGDRKRREARESKQEAKNARLRKREAQQARKEQRERERAWRAIEEERRQAYERRLERDRENYVARGNTNLYGGQSYITPRPLPWDVERKLLPGQCLQSHDTSGGKVRMFGYNCLENSYGHLNDLPDTCRTSVRGGTGEIYGYDAVCLRDRGYQLARR
ncbi:hypothetical protein R5H30_10020 [Sulfitobacter sp. D35]|uniref:hypothetical protein n=1 Tax=Sulfitobacter sp. D35 TaxID=3083252 RepID=UPI00296F73E7|nr:hypothetical protein [Sulfitobacter sp. D35]MDW4498315.1 hypothetical protein [Sulfitobacter sp. D35]